MFKRHGRRSKATSLRRMVRRIVRLFGRSVSTVLKRENAFNAVMLNDSEMLLRPVKLRRIRILGSGTYGVVKLVQDVASGDYHALKTSIFNPYVNNREIELLTGTNHPNIIKMAGFFFWDSKNTSGIIYQNILCEPFPFDLYYLILDCRRKKQRLCDLNIKIYSFQMFRGLAYLHAKRITHRDIKPANLLVDTSRLLLKITDFGCAKEDITKSDNTPYMCSRYYRAPELVLGNPIHDESIDIWSAACVVAECFVGQPVFPGRRGRQMGVICRILGNPTADELCRMNPSLGQYEMKPRKAPKLSTVLGLQDEHLATHLLQQCFQYDPSIRPTAWQACSHDFFDEVLERPDLQMNHFGAFETNSMPREIRAFLATKPRCKLTRSVPWARKPSSQRRYQTNKAKTTVAMNKIRRIAIEKLESARKLRLEKRGGSAANTCGNESDNFLFEAMQDDSLSLMTPKLFELTKTNKEVKDDMMAMRQMNMNAHK